MTYKCVFLGNLNVGKTSIIHVLINENINQNNRMTIFDNYCIDKRINEKDYHFSFWDTASQPEYFRIRKLSYPQTNIFIICFAINDLESYNDIPKWVEEIEYLGCEMILVGTKVDLRDETDIEEQVSYDMGMQMCERFNFKAYVECSAMNMQNIELILEKAVAEKTKNDEKSFFYKICYCCE